MQKLYIEVILLLFEVSLGEAVDTFLIGGAFGSKITAAGGGFKLLKQGAVNRKVNKILKNSKFETIGEAFGSITPPAPDVAGINNSRPSYRWRYKWYGNISKAILELIQF